MWKGMRGSINRCLGDEMDEAWDQSPANQVLHSWAICARLKGSRL